MMCELQSGLVLAKTTPFYNYPRWGTPYTYISISGKMRGRPAPIGLSLPTLNAQLSQIIVGAGSDISSPNEHVVSFLTSAVLQYVESVANLALDFAAQSGTDATAESVSAVIRDNFQLAQSAQLVNNWRRLRTMTRIDPCKATMEGYPTTSTCFPTLRPKSACSKLNFVFSLWKYAF